MIPKRESMLVAANQERILIIAAQKKRTAELETKEQGAFS
jgi:hypothetical protein